ncbi:MAG: peptidylprolyl isomerase [Bifidobacteriaceae bacterium]|nr:peptidylprolyl isomerase [Bifidobacteriaceae bacterium]
MAKRNLKRERERKKALARQQRMIAKAKRRRRNQLIAGITVAAVAVGGLGWVVVASIMAGRDSTSAEPTPLDTGNVLATETPVVPELSPPPEARATYSAPPDPALAEGREWTGVITTSLGSIEFTLDGVNAPQATANFIQLARDGYWDGSSCHRITTDGIYVLQCGSLTFDGTDNPGYQFGPLENIPADGLYPAGTMAMARAEAEDSQGGQFFITYQQSAWDNGYSVFGQVTSGLELIEGVAANGTVGGGTDGQPATTVTINRIELQ